MRRIALRVSLLGILLLAGCAGLSPSSDEAREVATLLAGQERLAGAKPDEQRREFAAAQAEHERQASDATRLRLALAMLLPRAPWRDDARTQTLLAAVEAPPAGQHSARHDLAQTLLRLLRAQREEQRRADLLAQQLREERRRLEDLQQKIDSLRAIDRETYQRRKAP